MRLVDTHCHLNADRFEADADLVIGGARLAGVERILVPGWNVASSERALALVERVPWLRRGRRRPSPRRRQGRRRRAGPDRRAGRGDPRGRGHRRDRARLRPRVQPDRRTSSTNLRRNLRPGRRHRQAGHPPLPLGGGPARCPGRPARRAAARRRRWRWTRFGAAAGHHPLVLRPARLRARRCSTSGAVHQLLGPRLPAWRGGVGRGRRARAGRSRAHRDRFAVPVAARRATLAQRTRVGARHSGMAGRAPGHVPVETLGDALRRRPTTGPSRRTGRRDMTTDAAASHASSRCPAPSSSCATGCRRPSVPRRAARRARRASADGDRRPAPPLDAAPDRHADARLRRPRPTPTPDRRQPTPCPVASPDGELPSDRLVDVGRPARRRRGPRHVRASGALDRRSRRQGRRPRVCSRSPSRRTRRVASGLPIEIDGEHVAAGPFAGMSLSNDAGEPDLRRPARVRARPAGPRGRRSTTTCPRASSAGTSARTARLRDALRAGRAGQRRAVVRSPTPAELTGRVRFGSLALSTLTQRVLMHRETRPATDERRRPDRRERSRQGPAAVHSPQ